jgi:hypothetical protein
MEIQTCCDGSNTGRSRGWRWQLISGQDTREFNTDVVAAPLGGDRAAVVQIAPLPIDHTPAGMLVDMAVRDIRREYLDRSACVVF